MVDYQHAVCLVRDELGILNAYEGDAWSLYPEHTREGTFGRMFFPGSDLYTKTRNPARVASGNAPFIVDRQTGAVVSTGAGAGIFVQ